MIERRYKRPVRGDEHGIAPGSVVRVTAARDGGSMIGRRYKRPVRKLYQPQGYDRICGGLADGIAPGSIVRVTAAWGPFRAIETVETPIIRGTCGKGSLVAVPLVRGAGAHYVQP